MVSPAATVPAVVVVLDNASKLFNIVNLIAPVGALVADNTLPTFTFLPPAAADVKRTDERFKRKAGRTAYGV